MIQTCKSQGLFFETFQINLPKLIYLTVKPFEEFNQTKIKEKKKKGNLQILTLKYLKESDLLVTNSQTIDWLLLQTPQIFNEIKAFLIDIKTPFYEDYFYKILKLNPEITSYLINPHFRESNFDHQMFGTFFPHSHYDGRLRKIIEIILQN